MDSIILNFNQIGIKDINRVGGKNASLGEMYQKLSPLGINIPNGFALTADAYWNFLQENNLRPKLTQLLAQLDRVHFSNLSEVGAAARSLILSHSFSYATQVAIISAYETLKDGSDHPISLAVRSSATAEDLPSASFAGQQESYLNISGEDALLEACLHCYASLFTDRAIKYREDQGFEHMEVAISLGIQCMVRSDLSVSGVSFTLDTESGFEDVVLINSSWGLGELIVKGKIDPDEFVVFKPALKAGKRCVLSRKMGAKSETLIYDEHQNRRFGSTTRVVQTEAHRAKKWTLTDEDIRQIAHWSVQIENHYKLPMDIEWAKDGVSGELYIVQARPETVHARKKLSVLTQYKLLESGEILLKGCGLGNRMTSGKVRILNHPEEAHLLQPGEILVTDITDPDWDPILKKVAGIITNRGGRTSHAAIVARELGAVAIVGATKATTLLKTGQEVTLSCAGGRTGYVYQGILRWEERQIDTSHIIMPTIDPMLILADPDRAFHLAALPNRGVGLMRMEFIINNAIQVHPMALVRFQELKDRQAIRQIEALTYLYADKEQYFVDKLAEAVSTIAAAFYPKEVIVRMSDFKSNEYAGLIGGRPFEPEEENPMLGFRGASRYYSPEYREGFRLECEALKVVRNEMGLTNVKLMIPFCRTLDEAHKVLDLMGSFGLGRGQDGLEVYVMVELPSNVILAEEFAKLFDGFSIGTNDLTQLTLGLDRDNSLINELFDERNPAVKKLIQQSITAARKQGIKVGLCGQAPSDLPDFARFLVEAGIDSISFNADALIQGIENIYLAENNPLESKQIVFNANP